jgi:hypothetical protein
LKALRKQGNCRKEKSSSFEAEAKKCRAETLVAIAFLGGFLEDVVHGCRWTKLKVECG